MAGRPRLQRTLGVWTNGHRVGRWSAVGRAAIAWPTSARGSSRRRVGRCRCRCRSRAVAGRCVAPRCNRSSSTCCPRRRWRASGCRRCAARCRLMRSTAGLWQATTVPARCSSCLTAPIRATRSASTASRSVSSIGAPARCAGGRAGHGAGGRCAHAERGAERRARKNRAAVAPGALVPAARVHAEHAHPEAAARRQAPATGVQHLARERVVVCPPACGVWLRAAAAAHRAHRRAQGAGDRAQRPALGRGRWWARLPGECMAQATGTPPYRVAEAAGGAGVSRLLELLRGSDEAARDRERLLAATVLMGCWPCPTSAPSASGCACCQPATSCSARCRA